MTNDIRTGIRFNDKHSYFDYGLYLNKPPDFGTPEPKVVSVEIPGRDGELDYSEAAAGEVKYNNRQMTFSFATEIKRDKRVELCSQISNDLHGRTAQIIYDLDSDWYYTGRCSVSFSDVQSWKMKVIITVDAFPYKLARENTIINVLPESFSAETILLGRGTSAQNINSIFDFGTSSSPQLDLTEFTKLTLKWTGTPWAAPSMQIVDYAGNVFNTTILYDSYDSGVYTFNLNVSSISGITKSKVYRILVQNIALAKLSGLTSASSTVYINVDRMTVVPYWTIVTPSMLGVTVYINGRKNTVYGNTIKDFGMRLTEGENQVSFLSDSEDTSVTIQFQNGRL